MQDNRANWIIWQTLMKDNPEKKSSRKRPDPPDYIVWRIFIYNSLTDFPVCRIIYLLWNANREEELGASTFYFA